MESEEELLYVDTEEYDFNNSVYANNTFEYKDINIKPEEIVALVLSTVTIACNITALLSISHVKGRLSTNLRLITSLTFSDILVSIACMAEVTHTVANPFYYNAGTYTICGHLIVRALTIWSHSIALLNLLGLALDHYCAIVKPLTYPVLMSHRRVNFMIMAFWLTSAVIGFSRFIIPASLSYSCTQQIETMTYCEKVECDLYEPEYAMYCIVAIAFFSMSFIYIRIFMQVRAYQTMQGRHSRYVRPNTRGLITTFLIVTTFALLWLPYCFFHIYIKFSLLLFSSNGLDYIILSNKAELHLYALVLLNSLCDPVIYAVRMREVRNGFRRLLMRFTKEGRQKLKRKITLERTTSNMSTGVTLMKNESNNETNL